MDIQNKAVVSYVVERAFLDYEAGEIVSLDQEMAGPFVDAGVLREASQEDMTGGEEASVEEAPEFVANAARQLTTKIDAAVEAAVKKAVEKVAHHSAPASMPKLPAVAKDNTWGFKSLGEFAGCVIAKETGNLSAARKLDMIRTKAPDTNIFGTANTPTVTGTDGGTLIPPSYAASIFEKIKSVTNLFDECMDYPFSGNTCEVPAVNETGPTNGITAAWVDETDTITKSKPVLSLVELKLKALAALVPLSEQLLQDNAYSLDAYLSRYVPLKMVYKLNDSVLNGTGSGANVVGSAATIALPRQTANRILFKDINDMHARMHTDNLPFAKWYVSPSNVNELLRLAFPDASGAYPIYTPNQAGGTFPGMSQAPAGTLLGRPVVLCDNMAALGSKADLMFADLSTVARISKQLDSAMSIHLQFDRYASVLRFVLRCNSKCQWLSTWTRADGVTASPYVVLDVPSGG